MKRIIREPLVHFLMLGALLFAAYALLTGSGAPPPERIVVSQGQLASMLEGFARTRQRAPTPEEWQGLIRARVREEVYYREALALGMDKDDAIIRRRLQQKMEFVSDGVAAQARPTDAELDAYLQAHPDTFRREPQVSFRQVYLDPEKHRSSLARDSAQLLAKLRRAGGDAGFAAMGDSLLLGRTFTALSSGEVERQFGREFAARLEGLPSGSWQGPVASAFGVHLVFVSERTGARVPVLADARDAVRREWDDAQRREASEKFYGELLKHYVVTLEEPAAEAPKKTAATKPW